MPTMNYLNLYYNLNLSLGKYILVSLLRKCVYVHACVCSISADTQILSLQMLNVPDSIEECLRLALCVSVCVCVCVCVCACVHACVRACSKLALID